MTDLAYICPRCRQAALAGRFCQSCRLFLGDRSASVESVSHTRRFLGDYVLEGILMTVSLFVGWLIWLVFTARTGQTPAKRLLNVYVLDLNTGQPVTGTRLFGRELAVKLIAVNILNSLVLVLLASAGAGPLVLLIVSLANLVWLADAAAILFDRDRRAFHDQIMETIVVHAPRGLPETPHLSRLPAVMQTANLTPAPATLASVIVAVEALKSCYVEGLTTLPEFDRLVVIARRGPASVSEVTWTRRFFGDYLLEGVLFICTLGVGWFLWFLLTARRGQTPAKSLVEVYVVDQESLQPPGAGYMWLREVVLKHVVVWPLSLGLAFALGWLLGGVGTAILVAVNQALVLDALFALFGSRRQALHDRVASTIVLYAPHGLPVTNAQFGQQLSPMAA